MRGRRLLAAVVTLACPLVLPTAAVSAAQTRAPASIRLASQTAWVGRGEVFRLGLTADDGGRDGLEVTVGVHRAITSRTEFQRTLEGRIAGSAFKTTSAELAELRPEAGAVFRVELPVQDPALPRDPTRLSLRGNGVYPVRVELSERGGGRVLSSFVTHLVYIHEPVDGPELALAWVAPVHAAPGRQPDGSRRLPPATASALAVLANELERRPDLDLTLAPNPETLDSLAPGSRTADADTLARLARVAQAEGRQVLGTTYVPVPLDALVGLMEDEGTAQLAAGTERVRDLLGVRADTRTRIVEGPVDETGLARLREQQAEQVVVSEAELTPVSGQQVTLTQPFELAARQGRRVEAGSADPGLAAHFRSGPTAVLAAHQLLADLAVLYFDFPGRRRGAIAVPPRSWVPSATFLSAFLDGVTSSPIVEPVTLDAYFAVPSATAGRGRTLLRTPRTDTPSPALPVGSIRAARVRLDAFGDILEDDESVYTRLERTLLVAPSLDLRPAQRSAYSRGTVRQVDDQLRGIKGPTDRSITLTARRGRIPVTVQKDVRYPVRVVLRVHSDQLQFPAGNTRTVELTRRNTTELFTVQARSSGAFPLTVTLESPDGRLTLATSRFTVRSTAASGMGVVLSIGAGGVLVVWWARSLLRRRRGAAT